MKRREYHHHHHERHTLRTKKPDGFIRRTIKGLAKKFNVSSRMIIIGFIVLFMFSGFFAMMAFFAAYLWVRNPGKIEDMFDRTVEKSRNAFDTMARSAKFNQTAAAGGGNPSYADDDLDFSDLKRKFDDLEKRTNGMEEHVSSDEYELKKEFDGIT